MPDLFLSLQKLLRCEVGLFGYLVLRCVRTGLFRSVAYGSCFSILFNLCLQNWVTGR